MRIDGGTFENSIVSNSKDVKIDIRGGYFDKYVRITAKDENACSMEITGGEFFAKITNTGKTGFIKGGKFYYERMPAEEYINASYYKVEDTI